MNVTCPSCRTIYRVDPKKIPAAGVLAQCARCPQAFEVALADDVAAPEQAVSAALATYPPPEAASEADVTVPDLPLLGEGDEGAAGASNTEAAPSEGEMPPLMGTDTEGASNSDVPSDVEGAAFAPKAYDEPSNADAEPPIEVADVASVSAPAAPSTDFDHGSVATEDEAVPAAYGASAMPADSGLPSPPIEQVSEEPILAEEAETAAAASLPPPPFGSSDPHQKARRLARALVSDIVVYHPDRRARGIRQGNLRQEFREEIRKSWEEYESQVGNHLARETSYFRDALNEILAEGAQLF